MMRANELNLLASLVRACNAKKRAMEKQEKKAREAQEKFETAQKEFQAIEKRREIICDVIAENSDVVEEHGKGKK